MICPKCGTKNDEDAVYCVKCGRQIKNTADKKSMGTNIKILIAICAVLIIGLGLVSGMLMQKNSTSPSTEAVVVNQTSAEVVNSDKWHEIDSFSGFSDDAASYRIKGNQFKIVASATPLKNYDTNMLSLDVSDNNNNQITSAEIDWASTEAITEKQKTIIIKSSPGTYWINIYAKDLSSWNIKVYDYY
jgi:uncharacterized protein HemX